MNQIPLVEFRRICHNDVYPRSRDMYPDLAVCIRVFLSSESLSFTEALMEDLISYDRIALIKAIYLLKVLYQRMPVESKSKWKNWLENNQDVKASKKDHLTFFHADQVGYIHPCHDATAINMGLLKGVERSKIKQIIEFGTA